MSDDAIEMMHLDGVIEYLQRHIDEITKRNTELREAATDFAKLLMVESFPVYDIAVGRAYEDLRRAIQRSMEI